MKFISFLACVAAAVLIDLDVRSGHYGVPFVVAVVCGVVAAALFLRRRS